MDTSGKATQEVTGMVIIASCLPDKSISLVSSSLLSPHVDFRLYILCCDLQTVNATRQLWLHASSIGADSGQKKRRPKQIYT